MSRYFVIFISVFLYILYIFIFSALCVKFYNILIYNDIFAHLSPEALGRRVQGHGHKHTRNGDESWVKSYNTIDSRLMTQYSGLISGAPQKAWGYSPLLETIGEKSRVN